MIESPEGIRGDTASNVQKPAKLETNLTVQVPLFIKEGEVIKVNTSDKSYSGRSQTAPRRTIDAGRIGSILLLSERKDSSAPSLKRRIELRGIRAGLQIAPQNSKRASP